MSNGIFKIYESFKVSYAMATPLVGFADESCHGGSHVITSNKRPPCYNCFSANFFHWMSFTFSLIGIVKNYWMCDFYLNCSKQSLCSFIVILGFIKWLINWCSVSESSSSKNFFSCNSISDSTTFSNSFKVFSSFGKLSINTVSSV